MNSRNDLPICNACGTQYYEQRTSCPVCDDPRQFVPPEGQSWTTLADLRRGHRNVVRQDEVEEHIWSIHTEPKFAIGQRCILVQTPAGTVLWDLVSLIDEETEQFIKSKAKGGLSAIVISHPHFYTTNGVWSEVFDCPVYVASDDLEWLFTRPGSEEKLKRIREINTQILEGVSVIKCGGHFTGSLCMHWDKNLFHSDTVFTIPAAKNPSGHRFKDTHTYSFLWSIPNMIPLDPVAIHQIWTRLKPFDFEASFGNIDDKDVRDKELKNRLLSSAKMQVRSMGWGGKQEGQLVLQEQSI